MMNNTTRSHSSNYNQAELAALQNSAEEKLDELLEYFGLDLKRCSKFYVGTCPIHGGSDNTTAFNIYHTGNQMVGNWKCWTHGCHNHFHPTIIGFVRGIISQTKYGWSDINDKDKECPFREAVQFLVKFTGNKSIAGLDIDYEGLEKKKFSSHIDNIYFSKKPKKVLSVPRNLVLEGMSIPSPYFISRGYSSEILTKYDIGECRDKNKDMYMRAVVPVYEDTRVFMIGCTGRSIFNCCPLCNQFHNPTHQCPQKGYFKAFKKWRHNSGFPAEHFLYNYWFAKDFIRQSGIAILVESPGNVWRLEEAGIHNSVGMFGAHLSDGQRNILDKSGALALIVLTDPDEAGKLALQEIRKSCGSIYTIYSPQINNEDIGETSIKLIQSKLVPYIKEIQNSLGT